ncbi:hypothetical protein [Saccharophagus degradans]|uniref:Uncharacterized protein n=1 Tax=Saccharophagus degradans (strain 2-40 / ATCC 43961 / DSM 17024) TaxID=203122 RepID=Q21L10_SACD2|nr:hypothetical protein [Saccharophagus degradans]ABD80619.1 hypothetical protein Sde_1357 [Saccharophagus degradans 2-40]
MRQKHWGGSSNLCEHHVELVKAEPQKAYSMWQGARAKGVAALNNGDLNTARQLLAVVFDIAKLQFASDITQGSVQISSERFAESARYYLWVLGRVGDHKEAAACLQGAHDGLLHRAADQNVCYLERINAFEMLREFRIKRVSLLNVLGEGGADCAWARAAEALANKTKNTLLH